jgi:hypothetical protein
VRRLLTDEVTLLQEFPLRPLDQPPQAYLKYDSWEKHIQSISPNEIPDRIPFSWNAETEAGNDELEVEGEADDADDELEVEGEAADDESEVEPERDKLQVSLYVATNLFLASNLALLLHQSRMRQMRRNSASRILL